MVTQFEATALSFLYGISRYGKNIQLVYGNGSNPELWGICVATDLQC
jgi:hypothetical protein